MSIITKSTFRRVAYTVGVSSFLINACLSAVEEQDRPTDRNQSSENANATPQQLNTIKVTASGLMAGDIIDSYDLEIEQAWDVGDIFELTPQIDIGGGGPNAKRLYLRGIAESLVSITIDGAKQSKDMHQHRGGLAGIDAELLKRVEVEAGPTAADAGPGAIGGRIRFTTKDAQDIISGGQSLGAFAKSSYANASEGWKHSLAASTLIGKVGLLAYFSDTDTGNYRAGGGDKMLGTSEESRSYFAKISLLDLASQDLRVGFDKLTQKGLYKWGSTGSDMGPLEDETLANRQRTERQTLTVNHSFHPDNDFIDTECSFYAIDSSLENLDNAAKYETEGLGMDLRNTLAMHLSGIEHNITTGVDYQNEDGISTRGEVESRNFGLFVQNRMKIGQSDIGFGLRYDDYETDFDGKTISGSCVSPNINAETRLRNGFSLFGGYGEAVSGANTIPVGWLTNLADELKFNGDVNGTLDPETSKKAEAGIKYHKAGLFSKSDRTNVKLTLFKSRVEDAIIVGTGGRGGGIVSDIVNDNTIESKGIEVSAQWGLGNFDATFLWAHSDVDKGGENLIGTIKRSAASIGDRIVINPRYTWTKHLVLGYTMNVVLKNENANANNDNAGGYVLHGLQILYQPQFLEKATVSLAVSNLFDKEYSRQTSLASSGETVREPGRDVRVSISYKF